MARKKATEEQTPLANMQAERAILGSVFLNNDTIYKCSSLKPEDFYWPNHRIVFERLQDLAEAGQPVDIVTASIALENSGHSKMVGGEAFLSDLIDGVPDHPHIEPYVEAVKDLSRRRKLVALARSAAMMCEDLSETTQDCISVTMDRVLDLAGDNLRKSQHVSEYAVNLVARIEKEHSTPRSELPIGLPTGVRRIDYLTTGLRPGELWIVASFTGEGKTVLATQIVMENCPRGVPVLWWTPEMTKQQVIGRMVPKTTEGQVKMRHLRDPRGMTATQFRAFENAIKVIETWPLWIDDSSSLEASHVYAHSMAMVKQHKIQLIVVDYLQLVRGKGEKRYEQVSNVSATLRTLAKDSGVPVLAVSQLSKPENREKRMPRIFDLKESGSIEQDAHVILMPYRPQDKEGHYSGDDLIVMGKQREGATGSAKVRFESLTMTFEKRGKEDYEDQEDLSYGGN
jgi:replicative DNA helicase